MKQKNFAVQVLEGAEAKRTYVILELSDVPNQPAKPVAVCESGEEIAQFFDNLKID